MSRVGLRGEGVLMSPASSQREGVAKSPAELQWEGGRRAGWVCSGRAAEERGGFAVGGRLKSRVGLQWEGG